MPLIHRRLAAVSLLALVAAMAGQANAASAPETGETGTVSALDPLTVSVTRTEKKADDVPATVSVITAATIEENLVVDIKDLVRFEPGVAVRSSPSRFTAAGASTGRDGASGFNIRGLEGNRVLIQVDGVRIPDAYSFGAQSVGRGDYVDLDVLKSVEIVRGPASALYGSDGVAGSVSFITKDPSDLLAPGRNWAARARVGYASADESWSKSAVLAGRSGSWEAMLAYTRRDGEGQKTGGDNDAPNITRTTANPEDNASNAFLGKLVYAPDAHNRLRLTWDHLDSDTDWVVLSAVALPPLAATSTLGLTAFDTLKRNRVSLDHRYQDGGGLISAAHTTVFYQDSRTRQYSAEDRNTAADRVRDALFTNRVWGAAVDAQSRFGTDRLSHLFVYGADYSLTRQVGLRDGTVPPPGEAFPTRAFPTTDYTLAGAFIQDEITTAAGKLSLYPALRLDYYKLSPKADPLFTASVPAGQSDSRLTPKFGAVFRASGLVTLFANAAAGFKAPSPSQVNNGFSNPVSNYRSVSNPDLKPETSRTVEGGVRLHGPGWSVSGAAFTGKYRDFIDQVQVSGSFTPANPAVYQFVNRAAVRISGVEARAQVGLGGGFTLTGAASATRGNSTTNGVKSALATIEPFKASLGLGWRERAGRFGGQVFAVYSAAKSAGRAGIACTPSCFLPADFAVFDATVFWNVTPAATLRAGVFNITDQTYYWWSDARGLASNAVGRQAYSQPGRNVSLSLALKL